MLYSSISFELHKRLASSQTHHRTSLQNGDGCWGALKCTDAVPGEQQGLGARFTERMNLLPSGWNTNQDLSTSRREAKGNRRVRVTPLFDFHLWQPWTLSVPLTAPAIVFLWNPGRCMAASTNHCRSPWRKGHTHFCSSSADCYERWL